MSGRQNRTDGTSESLFEVQALAVAGSVLDSPATPARLDPSEGEIASSTAARVPSAAVDTSTVLGSAVKANAEGHLSANFRHMSIGKPSFRATGPALGEQRAATTCKLLKPSTLVLPHRIGITRHSPHSDYLAAGPASVLAAAALGNVQAGPAPVTAMVR